MTLRNCPTRLQAALLIVSVAVLVTSAWAAPREKVLHNFNDNGKDGYGPQADLVLDASGNLYGTTQNGGTYNSGTVFELTPKAGGGWTEKMLHNFNGNGKGGLYPVASLIFDASGNLYGTTSAGGDSTRCSSGCGTVFELMPTAGGSWMEKVLTTFHGNGKDGVDPTAGVVFDASGNLYGTTLEGGAYGYGTVFELMPKAGGNWTEKVLHHFTGGGDGLGPYASLIFDPSGNLYSTTFGGGAYNAGTVFELMPKVGGGWKEKVLHNFIVNGRDGSSPFAALIFDASGNLYGTTGGGGDHGYGTVFELTPKVGGSWTERVLHSFNPNGRDGINAYGCLIFNAAGNLYSTTYQGGDYNEGTVFELTPKASGGWTERVLHSFNGRDGFGLYAGLISDSVGNLYGMTPNGGAHGYGNVFEISP